MTSKRLLTLLLSALLFGAGCGDDTGGDDSPLTWNPPDAGIPPRPDAASPQRADASGRVCLPFDQLPAEVLPRCRASTLECVTACPAGGDDSCRNACIGADDHPAFVPEEGNPVACSDCLFRQSVACMADAGCQAEVDAFLCCIIDNCIGGAPDCITTTCGEQTNAMYICGGTMSPSCFSDTEGDMAACYADSDPPMADAGVPQDGGML